MADNNQVKELTQKLEQGVNDLFNSEQYAEYLRTMSRFHRYSTRNTLLIHLQMPSATRVAGYHSWKNNFKRQVKKGEHGIKIFAPVPFTVKEQLEKLDPITKQPIIGEDGKPVTEEYIKAQSARFKVVPVFDVSQTEGEPLPELAQSLTGDVERYELFLDALRAVSPLPIVFEDLPPDTDGTCHFGDKISIRNGMSEVQTVSAIIHEMTHAELHDRKLTEEKPKDRRTEEVEAESVSYTVCQHYGIETGANSFGYVAEWSKTHELKELNASLDAIRKTAAELIDGIDERYQALAKERGIDLTATVEDNSVIAITPEPEAAQPHPILADYAAMKTDYQVGANALMTPIYVDGNFNREGKKIRIAVEEPVGKYQLFSRDEYDKKELYILTTSGRVTQLRQFFRDEWNEQTSKWENHHPTEAELDELLPQVAERFEHDLADPNEWARHEHAAMLNRLDECEAHNIPVRAQRKERQEQRRAAAELARQEEERALQEKYEARVDEIADAIKQSKTINVTYDEYAYGGKNPVLDLFKRHGINLPLRTQGWVNTGLAEITDSGYRYYKSKHKGNSTTFSGYLRRLCEAIKQPNAQRDEQKENKPMSNKLYDQLTELFPDFMSRKYSYLRLESDGFEPLSLEWVFGDSLSIMHTYTMNGDLCYDPMMEFALDSEKGTLKPTMFQNSIPPLYQIVSKDGSGDSIDGNGNQSVVKNLAAQLNEFAEQWFKNIGEQDYKPVKATLWNDGGIDEIDVCITFDADGNAIVAQPPDYGEPPTAEDLAQPSVPSDDVSAYLPPADTMLPDPTIGVSEMNLYGYEYDEMLPLQRGRALELHDADLPIYLLYTDGTESLAYDRDEIAAHDGLFGIEQRDWGRSKVYAAQRLGDCRFDIYQLGADLPESRNFRFASMRELEAHGLKVERQNYNLVYSGKLDIRDTQTNLNKIFQEFNVNQPSDFTGHSLSVSDVIVLRWRDNVSAHYVDSVGFKELPNFLSDDTYSQVGNSSPSKAKPSILDRILEGKKRVSHTNNKEVQHGTDR